MSYFASSDTSDMWLKIKISKETQKLSSTVREAVLLQTLFLSTAIFTAQRLTFGQPLQV